MAEAMNKIPTMASGEQLKNAKIAVLDLINKNKDILFGKVSDVVTRDVKESKWAEIADHARKLGAFPCHRTWDYLRDTTWQNWRKRFVEKREKKEKHEQTGQGNLIVYDEADLLISEILDAQGRYLPVTVTSLQSSNCTSSSIFSVSEGAINDIHDLLEIEMDVNNELPDDVTDGPGYQQSENHGLAKNGNDTANIKFDPDQDAQEVQDNYDDDDDDQTTQYQAQNQSGLFRNVTIRNEDPVPKVVSTSSLSSISRASLIRKSAYSTVRANRKRPASFMMSSNGDPVERELAGLKCRKIRAELELLKRETYKKDLEILQLERSLGLPASEMTRRFYRTVRTNTASITNNFTTR